ncbi:TetR family transcriptional regulator [Amycolatopsis vancoresmycina]|uniref:TetR family transcriptional regulator n=1 Tax=Amycolatopsis vancoresmycina DSM 44592 TaxID=1292037 RepID=R1HZ35_9PSEU|nr:TetR family transcriptional regulator [Amycolatopsis vancoresmycina]EOD63499.1 TetR family transcriptional regulator [Amycolatopsis vancoresmycina DSM 44592]
MTMPTVDWGTPSASGTEGLRERKKRLLRRRLTDTATAMFLERGFDAVRVAEIAAACEVSEKTVFNYFPSKEALVLDRPEATMAALRTGLARAGRAPVDAVLDVLAGELDALLSWLAAQPDLAAACARVQAFTALVRSTPALRAHHREMAEHLEGAVAEALADRTGRTVDDPLCQVAATALLGLCRVQSSSLRRNLDGARTPEEIRVAVTADVRSAARLVDTGLAGFAPAG